MYAFVLHLTALAPKQKVFINVQSDSDQKDASKQFFDHIQRTDKTSQRIPTNVFFVYLLPGSSYGTVATVASIIALP